MSTKTLQVRQKNQILQEAERKVHEALISLDKTDRPKVKGVLKFLQNNLALDEEWEKFKMHFEQVHPQFFENLKIRFPKLTENDLKYCAYLRINLSTKEISQVMNVDMESIRKKKYRMKQKMGLAAELTLADFMHTFELDD